MELVVDHSIAKIIIGASADETRMGLVENGKLMEYLVERTAEQHLVGSIFKGRVCNVVRGIQAAFVDIGLEQNAFLYLGDAMDVTEGQSLIVQISKDARGTKGPTATRELTLPGRYAVLLPQADYVGISRKITDKSERERLNKIYNQVRRLNQPQENIITFLCAKCKTFTARQRSSIGQRRKPYMFCGRGSAAPPAASAQARGTLRCG